jgi:cytidylate kinase
MKKRFYVVAIDGTAGSGKSTIARGVAKKLGWLYLDTGAMYRALTYKILSQGLDYKNEAQLKALLKTTTIDFRYQEKNKSYELYLDGQNVTLNIRRPKVDKLVSYVAQIPMVRTKMVQEQRKIAQGQNTICEGRDIGSVVFPNADVKFYIDCDLEERARRRWREIKKSIPLELVRNNLIERDYIDSHREIGPLKREKDAIFLDTTNLKLIEEIEVVALIIRLRLSLKA